MPSEQHKHVIYVWLAFRVITPTARAFTLHGTLKFQLNYVDLCRSRQQNQQRFYKTAFLNCTMRDVSTYRHKLRGDFVNINSFYLQVQPQQDVILI